MAEQAGSEGPRGREAADDAGVAPTQALIARSAVAQAPPVEVSRGWEVSARRSAAPLRLADASPLAKALVRAPGESWTGAPFGRARRAAEGPLVIGSRPGEWTLLGDPEPVWRLAERTPGPVVDLTHGLTLLRLTGHAAPLVMATLCAIDLSDAATPDGTAFTSSVAKVVTEVAREDLDGRRSYLLACDRSYGQYLFDAVRDAGRGHGLDTDGFPGWE